MEYFENFDYKDHNTTVKNFNCCLRFMMIIQNLKNHHIRVEYFAKFNMFDSNLLNISPTKEKYEDLLSQIKSSYEKEEAIEDFLKQVSELWKGYSLELMNYQNKCQIIRGWDDLFNKLKEHINSVSAMKLSPYFKAFEEEALSWEDKLNRINAVFDIWIDVQRRWVYLGNYYISFSTNKFFDKF
jgi:hypothetical protein